ncbi:MAG TPA: type II toxin-antitoxin system RelE/ParE family toxin [Candidatus Binataceae bacterium]|nr:type II toxin-antitoxin system RelE/ParE family toxin [Candidatus Binataceae bacterium]
MVIPQSKPMRWIGSTLDDLRKFPDEVKEVIGHALRAAQLGGKHQNARPLRGFHGAGVLEVIDDFDGDTYRAVYTIRFAGVVYGLHAFQKKSKKGIETPKSDIDLVKQRLKVAAEDYKAIRRG